MRPHPAQAIESVPWLPSAPSPRDCTRGTDPRRSPGRHVGRCPPRGPSRGCPAALRRVEKRCPSPGPSDPAAVREAVTRNDTLVSTPLGLRPTVHPRSPARQPSVSVQPASGARARPSAWAIQTEWRRDRSTLKGGHVGAQAVHPPP